MKTKIVYVVALLLSLSVFVAGIGFLVTDYKPLVADGQSMEPVYFEKDLLILDTEGFTVEEGDLIRYEYNDKQIGHEVVEVEENYYITKGVNNPERDPIQVYPDMVNGEIVAVFPVSPLRYLP